MDLESRIRKRGREFYALARGSGPVIFHKGWWMGKLLNWSMRNEAFKVRLFRFVDVFPTLHGESLVRHVEEYFGDQIGVFSDLLKWTGKARGVGRAAGEMMLAQAVRISILGMARQFMIGESSREAVKNLRKLRKGNFAFTLDILGEATVSEKEAERHRKRYLELLAELERETRSWEALGKPESRLDWGYSPMVQVSVKPTGLYSQANPVDFEGSVQGICAGFEPILLKAKELGAVVHLDMEQYRTKAIEIEVYKRLLSKPELGGVRLGIVLQAYLRDTEKDLDDLLNWSRKNARPISVRLVKGAYWDYETILSSQLSWPSPVYLQKAETDAAFERLARKILENHDACYLACGSHNLRSISAVVETAREIGAPEDRFEFQTLYGMAAPVRRGLLKAGLRLRVYCPYGELLPGMAYLVRRLLENTSNESFLRRSFVENMNTEDLLQDPLTRIRADASHAATPSEDNSSGFRNEPVADFTRPEVRNAFSRALEEVRSSTGKKYPVWIGGKEEWTADVLDSVNPARPARIVGRVCQAGKAEIDRAVAAALKAQAQWRNTPVEGRAEVLFKAAAIAGKRIYPLAAWQVLEVGKQWDQAYSDVTEAIDFLVYYGKEMIRLAPPKRLGNVPGELNRYAYEPRGVAAVIAPWNFPLAISCGMCSAALVTGNSVLYKPSGLSSVVGFMLAELFREAGVPAGVFNYVPGRSSVMGDYLVDHPDISIVAFTGSRDVGLRILERASRVHPSQDHVKRVIAEMGGKNAIIIDDDADLDEAVVQVVQSAFGFQGQKCSACSRVIVVDAVYEQFVPRLVEAARSLRIGPAEDPANQVGPVAEKAAQEKILKYIESGKREGTLLLLREGPEEGYYAPLAIFADIRRDHRLAQEEIFGPVLSVMRARSFPEALEIANDTRYALTGGVFSRSPQHLEQASREFRVGNLYLNRGITGAQVGRQPFGGFKLSGVGSKAGGPDYLVRFMNPRCITENTMRRGFAPSDDPSEANEGLQAG